MSDVTTYVQAEVLLPHEIDAALAKRSVVYIPLGSIEYHSRHLPVGLDGLNSHGVCIRAAAHTGGIVLPAFYYGVGGGHTSYPWTIMAKSGSAISDLLKETLRRLASFEVKVAVLFTGHFSDEQLALIDELADRWNASGSGLKALALAVNRTDVRTAPDHAGVFETTLLSSMWPDRVQLDRLPSLSEVPAEPSDPIAGHDHRHDPAHPLWGVMGPDPRAYDPDHANALLADIVSWTTAQVDRYFTAD